MHTFNGMVIFCESSFCVVCGSCDILLSHMQEGNDRILTLKQKKFCADGDIGGLSDHVRIVFGSFIN